jgi:lipopolysaccharide export system protein LptC
MSAWRSMPPATPRVPLPIAGPRAHLWMPRRRAAFRGAGRGDRRTGGDSHSRRVARLKLLLPALGLGLLLLVAAWPRLAALFANVGAGFAAIDLREARELKMVDPRYAGIDRQNRPYVLKAAVGRQMPDRTDLLSLTRPRAEMTARHGILTVTAATGIYQAQARLLDLFERVSIARPDGTRFSSDSAHVDFTDNTAEGHDPVEGHGSWGRIAAQGFRILDKGDRVIFTGRSHLVLRGAAPRAHPAAPPALPPAVARHAAAIEAAAVALDGRRPAAPPHRPMPARKVGRRAG